MSDEHDAVRRVVEAFEQSDWAELDVSFGELRVQLSTNQDVATPTPTASRRRSSTAGPDASPDPVAPNQSAVAPTTSVEDAPNAVDLPAGAVTVVSPSPGIFWCAPEPGAPPFTAVGHAVAESSTVGIVEVMKLMNHVKAGVAGIVLAVYVENGAAVDKGDPIVAVMPDAGGSEQ